MIGYFTLNFPGEYFDSGQSIIDSNIELDFRDVTTGHWVLCFVSGGHFQFLARGEDTYVLVSSRANLENGSRRYVFGPRPIGLKIEAVPGKVLSLGEIRLIYDNARDMFPGYASIDYEVRSSGGMSGLSHGLAESASRKDLVYDVSISQKLDDAELRLFMKRLNRESSWIARDIVDVRLEARFTVP